MPARPLNRVCYVEDDEDIQRIVRMSLERVGKMTVAVVSDPTQAIQTFAEFKPDLVMLDWMMPVLDGPAPGNQLAAGGVHHRARFATRPRRAEIARRGSHHLKAILAARSAGAVTRDLGEATLALV
jgi:CheY-like chemotaxis protein